MKSLVRSYRTYPGCLSYHWAQTQITSSASTAVPCRSKNPRTDRVACDQKDRQRSHRASPQRLRLTHRYITKEGALWFGVDIGSSTILVSRKGTLLNVCTIALIGLKTSRYTSCLIQTGALRIWWLSGKIVIGRHLWLLLFFPMGAHAAWTA